MAGGSIRSVLELSGYKNISAKNIGSPNKLQTARVCIQALNFIHNYYDKEKINLLKLKLIIYCKVRKTGIKYVGQLLKSIDTNIKFNCLNNLVRKKEFRYICNKLIISCNLLLSRQG